MQKILIVEDDKKIRKELEEFLNKHGFLAKGLEKFDNTIQDILDENADLVLLDINLPYIDGEFVCKEVRKTSNVPIIMVTSRDNEIDELMSLYGGADQYVTKPYNIQILLAKINGLLKRNQKQEIQKINCDDFDLNIAERVIEKDDKKIELTKNEYSILYYLAKNKGKVVSRDEIMDYLWESEEFIDDNTLSVNIKRLRNKLEELGLVDRIQTRRGQGTQRSTVCCTLLEKGISMSFKEFIKEKTILIVGTMLVLVSIEILLLAYHIGLLVKLYCAAAVIFVVLLSIIVEYKRKKDYYDELLKNMNKLKEKYLISEIIKTPNFIEGKILKDILQDTGKSMLENVNYYKNIQEDYKEYIELWIHEVKIPIAASKLIIENNKNSITKSIAEELYKVENYTEQALFYARSNAVEKDYIINKTNLKEIVNGAILKNKTTLLNGKVSIDLTNLKDAEVYTDSKWAIFIVNQIIQNAIKYSKEDDKKIEIFSKEKEDKLILYIKDNGIGIKKGEITRVFDRGFTGENGRIIGQKSTGIGLYICKKLCDKLGLGIELNSEKGKGTEVKIIFPKNSYTNF